MIFGALFTAEEQGYCNDPGDCNCFSGYGGDLCKHGKYNSLAHFTNVYNNIIGIIFTYIITIDLDVCGHTEPCQIWELCTNTGPDSHRCEALTFSGEMPASGDDIDGKDDNRFPEEDLSTEDHMKENSTNSSGDNKSSTLDIVSKGKCVVDLDFI